MTQKYLGYDDSTGKTVTMATPGGGGAAGTQVTWYPGTSVESPKEDSEFNQKVWLFSDAIIQQLYTSIKVPTSFVAGTQIKMKLEAYSPSTSNTFLIKSNIGLVIKNTDAAGTPSVSRNSTNSALTNTVANQSREVLCDLTDGSGQISGTTVQPGDVLEVYIWRDTSTDTDTADVRLRMGNEVTFS